LLQENDKDELKDKLYKLDQSSEKMKNQLDRSLEMLKKLQLNEKIDAIEKELRSLSKDQKDLKNETLKNDTSKDKLEDKQQKINDQFDQLKEDLKEMEKLNEELSDKMDIKTPEDLKNETDQNLQEAKEQLEKNKKNKATEKQEKASDNLEKMADQLNQQQEEANKQEEEEDINSLRAILDNLLTLSVGQEYLLVKFPKLNSNDPLYKRLGRKQRSIIDETKMVRDSLLALAKRQPKIASFVDKELNTLSSNHKLSLEDLDERDLRKLNIHQQTAMTSFNNLALLLNESLQSMQQQMQMKMDGNGSCSKPGKGKPKPGGSSPGDMKQLLKKQLEH
jgi:DNA repair exonuclease SbcCD ATPase subunit